MSEHPDPSEESQAVHHFLDELDRLIKRFSYEYDVSYAEMLGCLEIQKQFILDAMADRALRAMLEEEENEDEKSEKDEDDLEHEQ